MGRNFRYLTADRTSAGDEVYTPFYAVEPLLEFLPKDKKIWCPFDEEWSAFYQLLSEQGYEVERSSLNEGKDFFRYEPEKWDILVSNPPFSKKNEVLKRAFSFQKPFALLLPVNSIQSKTRYQIFENRIQMLCFDGRIDYHTWQNITEMCGKYGSVDKSVSLSDCGNEPIGKCPKCGAEVVKGKFGYYCKGKCGMNIAKVYGVELSDTQVKGLLDGKSTSYTSKGKKTIVRPEIVENPYNGKIYYQWRTERGK